MAEISEFLFDVKEELERRGHIVDQETIRQVVLRATHPLVRSKIESGEWTVDQVVAEIESGVGHLKTRQENAAGAGVVGALENPVLPPGTTMADFAEGGLVADETGQKTERIRRQFGLGGR